MDRIYAPWRIEWVEREADPIDGCPFCVLPDRENAREARVVARSDHNYALLNNAPYNPGHAMVIPDAHVDDWTDLDDATMLDHARLKAATLAAMRRGIDPDGFNAGLNLGGGAAGGSIDHLHTHVVPRWGGDTNFMPVVGDTKVIVEAVDRSYEHLHEGFAAGDDVVDPGDLEAGEAVRLSFDLDLDDA
ncbi:Diadenosine tetraphosphate (Ap4A) hydrolase [Halorubrum aquaticum]|uniref:Diadenosine tetraphosphate (Ap4A) hydrolase n=1 Tax=Halorubrum aquaticum TaxID=387340 RepID=A0A1I3BP07_9EURY|nr:HIT domain-containing protein [Halorubrum aquaticum]SFH63900.1 Diadenosine tetraphosphate (Ap4A) hydrolase [Halorubrum aquaticum]